MTYKVGTAAYRKAYQETNREALRAAGRERYYVRVYGVTLAEAQKLLESQRGLCAICDTKIELRGHTTHLDHCHVSKKIRGVLCNKCNLLLGYADEHPMILRRAAAYLRRHSHGK